MTKADTPRNQALAVGAVLVLTGAVIWLQPAYPTQDGPPTLFIAQVMNALSSSDPGPYGGIFELNERIPPNALIFHLAALLLKVFSPDRVEQFLVSGYAILLYAGFTLCGMALRIPAGLAALAATPLVFGYTLQLGLLGFSWSLALCFLGMALWLWSLKHRSPSWLCYSSFTAIGLLAYFTHVFGAAYYLVILAFGTLAAGFLESRGNVEGSPIPGLAKPALRRICLTALSLFPVFIAILWFAAEPRPDPIMEEVVAHQFIDSTPLERLAKLLLGQFMVTAGAGDATLALLLHLSFLAAGAILLLARMKSRETGESFLSRRFNPEAASVTAVIPFGLLLYFASPGAVQSSVLVVQRQQPFLYALLSLCLLALAFAARKRLAARVLTAAFLTVSLALMGLRAQQAELVNRFLAEYREAAVELQRGESVVAFHLSGFPAGNPLWYDDTRLRPLSHEYLRLAMERQAAPLDLLQARNRPSLTPIAYREEVFPYSQRLQPDPQISRNLFAIDPLKYEAAKGRAVDKVFIYGKPEELQAEVAAFEKALASRYRLSFTSSGGNLRVFSRE